MELFPSFFSAEPRGPPKDLARLFTFNELENNNAVLLVKMAFDVLCNPLRHLGKTLFIYLLRFLLLCV